MCQLFWQTDICLRVLKVTDAIAETGAEVTNANQVAGRESAVLRTWGKRMVEGSGKDTYSSKKAKFKGERSRFTIGQKLAILDETRQPNALQKDVLRKHHLARSTFARWRKQEKEWRAQIKKRQDRIIQEVQAEGRPAHSHPPSSEYILRTKSKYAEVAADPSDWWMVSSSRKLLKSGTFISRPIRHEPCSCPWRRPGWKVLPRVSSGAPK